MKHILVLIVCVLLSREHKVEAQTLSGTTADRIKSRGYTSETHEVITKDGYILSLYRIMGVKDDLSANDTERPVVLMMHGLVSSSDCWVIGETGNILAFNLVDSGYDVWLGNSRGTPYAKRHLSRSAEERAFWRFSWHELGIMDLPNTIDYILKVTQQPSLHYVGHSQGTTILFVLLSSQPRYNKMLKSSHLMAPVAFMKNARSSLIRYTAPLIGTYSHLDPLVGDVPFLQHSLVRMILGIDKCRLPEADASFCASLLFSISGGVTRYLNNSLLPEIFSTHPASCSTHQAIHLVQLYVSGRFRRYDYGITGNRQRYGSSTPPDYKLENINPRYPLHLYYSNYDELSAKADVEKLSRLLGNKTMRHYIDLRQFAHIDFLWASNAKKVLYDDIMQRMSEVEEELQEEV